MQNSIDEKEDLRLKYQIVNDNIRFAKQQKWNTIYYTLTAIGGIIALTLGTPSKFWSGCSFQYFLVIISTVITSSGIYFIWRHQNSSEEYRSEKEDIRKKLFNEEKYKAGDKDFAVIFTIIIAAAWFLELYLILYPR